IHGAVEIASPVPEQKLAEAGPLDALEELLGNDLIGIDVGAVHRDDAPGVFDEWLHGSILSPVVPRQADSCLLLNVERILQETVLVVLAREAEGTAKRGRSNPSVDRIDRDVAGLSWN